MPYKLAEAPPVLQRGVEAVRANVMFAGLIGVPDTVTRHAVRLPDALLQIRGERHAGGALQHVTQQPGAAR